MPNPDQMSAPAYMHTHTDMQTETHICTHAHTNAYTRACTHAWRVANTLHLSSSDCSPSTFSSSSSSSASYSFFSPPHSFLPLHLLSLRLFLPFQIKLKMIP